MSNVYIVFLDISQELEQSYEYDYDLDSPIRYNRKFIQEFLDKTMAEEFCRLFELEHGISESQDYILRIHECNIKFRNSFYNRFLNKGKLLRA
jgi:hypothetical protein